MHKKNKSSIYLLTFTFEMSFVFSIYSDSGAGQTTTSPDHNQTNEEDDKTG